MGTPVQRVRTDPITVSTSSEPVGLKDKGGTQVDPATDTTLSTVDTDVKAVAAAVVNVDTDVQAVKTSVDAVDTDVQAVKTSVDAVDTDVQAVKTSIDNQGATTPTLYNVTMTNADTEYSQVLPANIKKFSIHLRDYTTFRFAYTTGKVATPTAPYTTIPDGAEKYESGLNPSVLTLYFASGTAGKIAEIEAWT